MVVRPAGTGDVDALGAIEVSAGQRFREVGMPEIADDEPPGREVYAEAVADGRVWVAERDGAVVGYAWAIDLDGQALLEQLSVAAGHHGSGIGSALIEAVLGWARDRGWRSLTLSTFAAVPFNGPFYARRGFVVVPEHEYGERFADLRRHEASLSLDVEARVVMRRPIP